MKTNLFVYFFDFLQSKLIQTELTPADDNEYSLSEQSSAHTEYDVS